MRKLMVFPVIALAASSLFAQDAENCKESTLLSRMKGCVIQSCDNKDFDQAEIQVGLTVDGPKTQAVEGQVEITKYTCPGSVSALAIVRNAENALKAAGFTGVFSGKGDNERPSSTLRKGGVWVNVFVEYSESDAANYTVTIVRSKEMEQQMVASAEEMEADIAKSGYCSIYGIHFDTGNATILPDSEQCLAEVAKLLKKNPSWKMQVEGHTDNVGAKEANLKLSQARADAVRGWLASHGVGSARLMAKGFGDTKPVANNTNEEGRAKNRRVDLRKL